MSSLLAIRIAGNPKDKMLDVFVGAWPHPVATITRSNGGVKWQVHFDVEGLKTPKRWDTLEAQTTAVADVLQRFFDATAKVMAQPQQDPSA